MKKMVVDFTKTYKTISVDEKKYTAFYDFLDTKNLDNVTMIKDIMLSSIQFLDVEAPKDDKKGKKIEYEIMMSPVFPQYFIGFPESKLLDIIKILGFDPFDPKTKSNMWKLAHQILFPVFLEDCFRQNKFKKLGWTKDERLVVEVDE